MKEVIFLLFLLHFQSGNLGFNTPGKLWNTEEDGESPTTYSDMTPSPTVVPGSVNAVTTAGSPYSEIQVAKESASQAPTSASSGKTLGMKAGKKTSNSTTSIPTSQSNGHSDGDSDKDKMRSSSSSEMTSLQSNARKAPLQQEVTPSQDRAAGNRVFKQPSYSTDITNTQSDANSKTSGSQTTRGK